MTLVFLIALALVIAFFLFRRDRSFLKKKTKDAVSPEMREFLNLPATEHPFPKLSTESKPEKKSMSRKLLEEMNSKNDA